MNKEMKELMKLAIDVNKSIDKYNGFLKDLYTDIKNI